MTIRILTLAISFAAALGFANTSMASELDNESSVINEQALRAKDLPATVIVRVNEKTGEAAVLETSERLSQDVAGASLVAQKEFKTIAANGLVKELDQLKSTSSWYAWFNLGYYYAPTYYYYNYSYNYRPYYSYTYYGYSYRWFRWW